jgi:hypothetical protein
MIGKYNNSPEVDMPYQTYQQVRDVVTRIRSAHQSLRDELERPRPRARDANSRLMLEELRRSEQQLQIELARQLAAAGTDSLLDTWLQFIPDEDVLHTLDSIEFTPEMTVVEIVDRKLEFDQALMALLRQLAEETAVPRVQEFFRSLLGELERRVSRESWSVIDFPEDVEPRRTDE